MRARYVATLCSPGQPLAGPASFVAEPRAVPESAALRKLLAASSSTEADAAVAALTRGGYRWSPLGRKEGNYGLVNIGSDPAVALVERVTNAIDAVIDAAARTRDSAEIAEWESPRDAVTSLFGVAEGRLGSIAPEALAALSERVRISIFDGKRGQRPTIEIRDLGTGISGDAMPNSILDLAGSNKLDKLHLAGAYGQGGSTTFAFTAGGTLIASRAPQDAIALTFVRFRDLDPRRNKNGRYDYLTTPDGAVPSLAANDSNFPVGTLVRHFDYELPQHHGPVDAPTGLLGLLRATLFDPVLPVHLVDRRGLFGLAGSAGTAFAGARAALDGANDTVAHRQSLALPFGRRSVRGTVVVRYWLLRACDAATTIHPDLQHPVLVTNFGQTHDAWDHRFIVDTLKLPFLKTALVVQVELDALSPEAKRQLFSTTRDRLKRGALYHDLVNAVSEALLDERALHEANVERRRALLREQHATDQRRLQKRFAELMEKFHPGHEPAASANGRARGLAATTESAGDDGTQSTVDLPTLEHPTFIAFAAKTAIEIPQGGAVGVRLESDAPDGYCTRYAQARLVLAPDPPASLEMLRAGDFRGGRARITVRAQLAAGTAGTVTARLTTADGAVLAAAAPFTIVPAAEREGPADSTGRKPVRLPRIFDVYRDRWRELEFDDSSVAFVSESRDDYSIFVNMDNRHIARLLASVPYQEQGLARMRGTYLVQAAFYAFLLHEQRAAFEGVDAAQLATYQRLEMDRVARTVVTSIASAERIDSAALGDPLT